MKSFLQRYGLITVSLGALFASGVVAGFQWGRYTPARVVGTTISPDASPLTAEQWGENAASALQRDLNLTDVQTDAVRSILAEPSRLIFDDRHRGNLKIHLRLLEAHDTISDAAGLTDKQKALLKSRREQLRLHILEKFRDLIGDKPDPILSKT